MLDRIMGMFSSDIGIDLGTANTLVFVRDRGIVIREPSVVAVQTHTGQVMAVGNDAKAMLGRTPQSIQASRPLKDGVIADFDVAEAMIRYFIGKVHSKKRLVRPRVVLAVPSGITKVERRNVRDSVMNAGARDVFLIEEPMAAAFGVGLPVTEPTGSMIVDIGGGTTEIAVISLRDIVYSKSVKVGGDKMDEAIIEHIRKEYNLLIGERAAEEIKIKMGSAVANGNETTMEVKGRDNVVGMPRTQIISSEEVRQALQVPVNEIIKGVCNTLENCLPELSADLVGCGMVLAGGGSLLRGLDTLISEKTGLPVHVAENPLDAVAEGTGKALPEIETLRKMRGIAE
ncbi:MAG TPA: rod shape-determining protein [Pontiella sp.]